MVKSVRSSVSGLKKGSLKRNTSLKSGIVKKTKPRKTLEQKTAQQLQDPADTVHSRYVRLRDSKYVDGVWVGTCMTCSKTGTVAWYDETGTLRFSKGWDGGHFISRGYLSLRYEEENVNLQCSFRCNKLRSGEYQKYKLAIEDKYGEGVYQELERRALLPDSKKRLPKEELLQIIHDSKEYVKYAAAHPDNYS